LLSTLRDDYKIPLSEGIDNYDILKAINISIDLKADGIVILQNCIKAVLCLLKIHLDYEQHLNDMYLRFFEKIQDRVQRYGIATDYASVSKFFKERDGVVLSTIHGIKGEEYTTVIAFALLNGYLPHWDYIMKNEMKSLRIPADFRYSVRKIWQPARPSSFTWNVWANSWHKTERNFRYSVHKIWAI